MTEPTITKAEDICECTAGEMTPDHHDLNCPVSIEGAWLFDSDEAYKIFRPEGNFILKI